jgi:hypothetical protein
MSVLIVLANEYDITAQYANIKHAIAYAAKFGRTRTRIDWFLSGATRSESSVSEAQRMSEAISMVSDSCILVNKNNWHYIHDNRSINIHNNFVRLKEWLEFNQSYQEIRVVTSNNLASHIAEIVIPGNNFKWIYSDLLELGVDNLDIAVEFEKRQGIASIV